MAESVFLPHNRREARGMALALGRAAAWGGLTLVDPAKLEGSRHTAFWAACAGLGAVEMLASPGDGTLSLRARLMLAATTAGTVFVTRDWATRTDARLVRALRHVRVRHPRRWMAAFTAAGAFAAYLTELQPSPHDDVSVPLVEAPLPGGIRDLIASMLQAVDGYQREVLEAQLASATVLVEDPEWPLTILVDESLPGTLLGEFTWPVSAEFTRDGRTHRLYLDIVEGRLAVLGQYLADDLDSAVDVDWSWPAVSEVTIRPGAPA
ncbi:hypothetical protein [Tessaracoccus flavus]|nr:hypothetical protein [Tessaracoccus flavus]SDY93274.1 hypothetical protein SAMN05428934_106118 [Tessaracoccus flavus]